MAAAVEDADLVHGCMMQLRLQCGERVGRGCSGKQRHGFAYVETELSGLANWNCASSRLLVGQGGAKLILCTTKRSCV